MEQYLANLNWFDITLLSVVGLSCLFATFRGFIKAFFSLVTWVASSALTVAFYPFYFNYLSTKIVNEKGAMIASFISAFICMFIVIAIINGRIVFSLRKISGGFFDRTLGLLFGAARGILIVCLIFFSIKTTSEILHSKDNSGRSGPEWFTASSSYDVVSQFADKVMAMVPEDVSGMSEDVAKYTKNFLLKTMGDRMRDAVSDSAGKVLSHKNEEVMRSIISNLPKEEQQNLSKKYGENISNLSEFEMIEMFNDIIETYEAYKKDGKIAANKAASDKDIQNLKDAINEKSKPVKESVEDAAEDLGYKERNIKQMDRLIEGVRQ